MSLSTLSQLLMIGTAAKTYRRGNLVRKECHVVEDEGILKQNSEACETEADVYQILGKHPFIANCRFIDFNKRFIELDFYRNKNLKEYVREKRSNLISKDLKRWARQMIESIAYIYDKWIRYSDLRLDQWLLDEMVNARLSDFNAAGFDA